MFELMDSHSEEAVIKVIGVGGGGGNAVELMVAQNIEGVRLTIVQVQRCRSSRGSGSRKDIVVSLRRRIGWFRRRPRSYRLARGRSLVFQKQHPVL